jgi:hypothetical protein
MYLDFETEADLALEHTWGLGKVLSVDDLLAPDMVIKKSVPDMKSYLNERALALPLGWVADVFLAEKESKKTRSGALDAIRAVVGARERRISSFGLDPERCTVSLAAFAYDDGAITTLLGRHGNEGAVLDEIWDAASAAGIVVGYNIFNFDIKVLLSRSAQLGVKPTRQFDLNPWQSPWRSPEILDIMVARFGRDKAKRLKDLGPDLGIEPLAPGVDGSMVSTLSDEKLMEYGDSDIDLTRRVHIKLGGYYWPDPGYGAEDEIPF